MRKKREKEARKTIEQVSLLEERELLHKQLELLAERSKGCTPTELAKLSAQMTAIYMVLCLM